MVEFLGEPRSRTKKTTELMGVVYTMSRGFYEVLGTSYSDIEEHWSDDYWHKRARLDGSLPATDCVISRHFRDPLRMTRSNLTFRFDKHAVSDQGTATQGGLDSVRPPRGSAARSSENAVLTQELLAATNPFRSEYSVPVALKELVDVSSMFKIACKGFASFVGSSYLNYKFGWTQFYRDVLTLHKITTALERRIKELQSLSKHGGTRRKVHLRSKSQKGFVANHLVNSTWGTTVRVDSNGYWLCSTHGTVRWRFKPGLDVQLDKLEAFNLAVRKVFDLEAPDSQTLWELVPWSWLFDYFVNLSDFYGANLGEDVIEPYDICIVRRSKSRFQFKTVSKPSSVTITGSGRFGRDEYDRQVVSKGSFPAVSIGLLSRSQLLIIASLIASFKR